MGTLLEQIRNPGQTSASGIKTSSNLLSSIIMPKDPSRARRIQTLQQEAEQATQESKKANSFMGLFKETIRGLPEAAHITDTIDSIKKDIFNIKQGQLNQPSIPKTPKDALKFIFSQPSINNPNKFLEAATTSLKDSFISEKEKITELFNTPGGKGKKVGQTVGVIAGGAGVLLSPIGAFFSAAETVPVLGTAAKIINAAFTTAGTGGTYIADGIINQLPVSEEIKKNLKPGFEEIFALASQIVLGKATHVVKIGLEKKYGKADAEIITTKAQELADNVKTLQKSSPVKPTTIEPGKRLIDQIIKPGVVKYDTNIPILKAFEQSRPIKQIGNFELGTLGEKTAGRKSTQVDRFPQEQLKETISNIKESYRASGDPNNYRYDNTAHIAQMPGGEKRVIYTRLNKAGKEEIINWHKISDSKFLETLKSNGIPERNRTPNLLVRTEVPYPLGHRDNLSISRDSNISQTSFKVANEARNRGIIENFPEMSKIDPRVLTEQSAKASEVIQRDFQSAIDQIKSTTLPEVYKGSLFTELKEKALKEGDLSTIIELSKTNIGTEAAQALKAFDDSAKYKADPVSAIKEIRNARISETEKKMNASVKKIITEEKIKFKEPKIEIKTWTDFIKSIEC